MSVTIRDIAEAAGVSIGTVSRALKNQRGLSDETRRQVREVARNLGYDPGRLRSANCRGSAARNVSSRSGSGTQRGGSW